MIRIAILATLCLCAGCLTTQPAIEPLPVIHPKVFSMVRCWWSDTEQPIVTEINLDAVEANRNQFDYGSIINNGQWISVKSDDSSGYMRYQVIGRKGNLVYLKFQDNGGGSLTYECELGISFSHRTIEFNGRPKLIRVLRIETMK